MKRYLTIYTMLIFLIMTSCSLDPAVEQNVEAGQEESIDDLVTLIDGAYESMEDPGYMGRDMVLAGEIRADNVFANNRTGRWTDMSKMEVQYTNSNVSELFRRIYATTANPNIILAVDLDEIEGENSEKDHIIGEAYAIRAMVHFDLLRLFGQTYLDEGSDLGIAYVKDFKDGEMNKPRESVEENKAAIYEDIEEAIKFLGQGSDSERAGSKTNFSLDAAYALKSRVGTYFKDYDKVREASEEIIGNYDVTSANDLVEYWSIQEPGPASIFELEYNSDYNPGINGLAELYRIYENNYGDVEVFANFIEDAKFGNQDVRASDAMIGMEQGKLRNMGKFPSNGDMRGWDNIKVFRYEEVVLNYAEALLEDNPGKAKDLLNEIAQNRNGSTYTVANIDNILEERRKELVFEGFRFFDLARHQKQIRQIDDKASNRHGEVEPGSYKLALPIPQQEMDSNSNAEQNPGY